MKLVKAVIRPEKLTDVLFALFEADVRGFAVPESGVTAAVTPVEDPGDERL